MADETKTPKHPADKAKGAGTSDPTAPGGASFDVDNASAEEFAKHEEILRRRSVVAGLTPAPSVGLASTIGGYTPAPDDIRAVKDGEERYFSQLTWDAMETKGKHDGWEVAVAKPADL